MIDHSGFQNFREKYSDPILSALAVAVAVLIFVLVPIQATTGAAFLPFGVGMIGLLALGVMVLAGSLRVFIPIAIASLLHLLLTVLHDDHDRLHPHVYLIASLWLTLTTTFAVIVARAVYRGGVVTTHRIIGAILLYLLIALIFASLYLFVGGIFPGAFAHLDIVDLPSVGADVIYFSLTTLTSVGYGDIFPLHPIARSVCNLEAICGQLYPAILIARLVSLHIEARK